MFLLRASRGLSLKSPGVGQDAALGPVAKGTFGGSDLAAFLSWSSISSFLGSFVEASAGGGGWRRGRMAGGWDSALTL